jgi:exonuclease SbcC
MDLEDSTQKLAVAKRMLDEADSKLKKLEEKRQIIEEHKRKEARLSADIANVSKTKSSLVQNINGKKVVLVNLRQRQVGLDTQTKLCLEKLEQAGLPVNQPVESLHSSILAIEDEISGLRADKEATSRNLETDKKRVVSLSQESKCPLCVQPLDGEYKSNLLSKIQQENSDREKTVRKLLVEIDSLQKTKTRASEAYSSLQTCMTRSEELKTWLKEEENNLATLSSELEEQQKREKELHLQLEQVAFEISRFDLSEVDLARSQKEQAFRQYYSVDSDLHTKENRKEDLFRRLDEIKERINIAQEKLERMEKTRRTVEVLGAIRDAYRSIQPKLRSEFVKVLRNYIQQVLDGLVGGEAPLLNVIIDDTYTPYVKSEAGIDREVSNLSGGERTLLAFAYRLGLGQLIMQSRTGHGLSILVLDEPTENLGSEDGSIERLAEAISRLKAIEQIIAVTHSEAFAAKGEHVVTVEKEAGVSRISI